MRTYRGARGSSPSLRAQVADVNVDDVVIAEPLPAPHALEQPLAAERHPRLAREHVEQVELELRQLDRLAATTDLSRRRVDLEVTEATDRARLRAARSRAAEHRPDARHQLARRERLGDVVIGAG